MSLHRADARAYEKKPEMPDSGLKAPHITKATAENILNNTDSYICDVNAFKLFVPSGFNRLRPYLILKGNARYTVDIVTFGTGAYTKIENFIKKLRDQAKELAENVAILEMQLNQTETELAKKDEYADILADLTQRLSEIDKELGI